AELRDRHARGAFLLDVRSDGEWQAGHIEGARHIMGGYLAERAGELPKDKPIHVICGSGYRSSIATSVLRRAGFTDVIDVVGGMAAWNRQSFPTIS
ncbi:MAG: rhodanese-like domain-containing protein, partial [Candidatus Acidiferrales bacterium]